MQVVYRLSEEMDKRGGTMAVVLSGYEKPVYAGLLGFSYGALASRWWLITHW